MRGCVWLVAYMSGIGVIVVRKDLEVVLGSLSPTIDAALLSHH